MRIIKLAIISLVFFSLLITAISLLIPSHIRLTRTIDIQTEKKKLLDQLSDSRNWQSWYPGMNSEDDSLKGLVSETKITSVTDSSVIATTTSGGRNFSNGWTIYPGMRPDSYTVQWYMDFKLRWYPWEKFSSLMFEKRYGNHMEAGLQKLQSILEK